MLSNTLASFYPYEAFNQISPNSGSVLGWTAMICWVLLSLFSTQWWFPLLCFGYSGEMYSNAFQEHCSTWLRWFIIHTCRETSFLSFLLQTALSCSYLPLLRELRLTVFQHWPNKDDLATVFCILALLIHLHFASVWAFSQLILQLCSQIFHNHIMKKFLSLSEQTVGCSLLLWKPTSPGTAQLHCLPRGCPAIQPGPTSSPGPKQFASMLPSKKPRKLGNSHSLKICTSWTKYPKLTWGLLTMLQSATFQGFIQRRVASKAGQAGIPPLQRQLGLFSLDFLRLWGDLITVLEGSL